MKLNIDIKPKNCIDNLKKNYLYLISAAAFYFLGRNVCAEDKISNIYEIIAAIIAAALIADIPSKVAAAERKIRCIAIIAAAGLLEANLMDYICVYSAYNKIYSVPNAVLQIVLAALSFPFVTAFFCIIYKYLWDFAREHIFNMSKPYKICLITLFIVFSAYIAAVYLSTDIFYVDRINTPTDDKYTLDLVYTTDSLGIYLGNAYLQMQHLENDIRQMLFSFCSAPFLAIPQLLTAFTVSVPAVKAIIFAVVQLAILLTGFYLLAKMLHVSDSAGVCFIVLFSLTYTFFLFSITPEQYIISFFWLIMFLYTMLETNDKHYIPFWGAVGTLIVSAAFVPMIPIKNGVKKLKEIVKSSVSEGLKFCAAGMLLGRFEEIMEVFVSLAFLTTFMGGKVSFLQKIEQFTHFVKNIFYSPSAHCDGMYDNPFISQIQPYISWQLDPITGVSAAGIIILALCALGFAVSNKDKLSRVSAYWVVISFIVLGVVGWGTAENGLILYSLYFGWAYAVLLFRLICFAAEKIKLSKVLPCIVSAGAAVFLLVCNIPSIAELLDFAVRYYPCV